METTFIILSKNCESYFKKYLYDLMEFPLNNVEFIIVDNGSQDKSVETINDVIAKFQKGLGRLKNFTYKVIVNDSELPRSSNINFGLREASGKYIFITNPRSTAFYDWFSWMKKKIMDPSVGIVAPLTNDINANQDLIGLLSALDFDFAFYKKPYEYYAFVNSRFRDDSIDVDFVESFCLLTKKEVIEKVGFYDESFQTSAIADFDFCYRVHKRELKTVVAKDVFVYKFTEEDQIFSAEKYKEMQEEDIKKLSAKFKKDYGITDSAKIYTMLINSKVPLA